MLINKNSGSRSSITPKKFVDCGAKDYFYWEDRVGRPVLESKPTLLKTNVANFCPVVPLGRLLLLALLPYSAACSAPAPDAAAGATPLFPRQTLTPQSNQELLFLHVVAYFPPLAK